MCLQVVRSFACGCARHHKVECRLSNRLRLSSPAGAAPLAPGEACETLSGPRRFRFGTTMCPTCAYARLTWRSWLGSGIGVQPWAGLMKNGLTAERALGFRRFREMRARLQRTLHERDREEKDTGEYGWKTEHWRRMLRRKRIRREVEA
ncbi:hypothetical protein N0V85_008689, partial [Neurospora sp. IMI 360204]